MNDRKIARGPIRADALSVLLAAFGVFVLAALSQAEDAVTLPLSCIDFPPYKIAPAIGAESGSDAAGQPLGMDIEIILAAFSKSAYRPQFEFMPFKRAIELAAKGDYAGICGCSHSAEREASFLFSDPVNTVSLGLFASSEQDFATISSIADLRDRDVIMVNGYVLEKDLRASGARLSLVPNDRQAAITFQHRPHAILASYRLPIEYRRQREKIDEPIFYRELSSGPNYLCLSRKFPEAPAILDAFNLGLERISEDGTLAGIRDRYHNDTTVVPVN